MILKILNETFSDSAFFIAKLIVLLKYLKFYILKAFAMKNRLEYHKVLKSA